MTFDIMHHHQRLENPTTWYQTIIAMGIDDENVTRNTGPWEIYHNVESTSFNDSNERACTWLRQEIEFDLSFWIQGDETPLEIFASTYYYYFEGDLVKQEFSNHLPSLIIIANAMGMNYQSFSRKYTTTKANII